MSLIHKPGELLKPSGRGGGAGNKGFADDAGVPYRLWLRDKDDVEGDQGIYYFFCLPSKDTQNIWAGVDEARTQWAKSEVVSPLPRTVAEVPLEADPTKPWRHRFDHERALTLFTDREGKQLWPDQTVITSVVTPSGDVRLIGFKKMEWTVFSERLDEAMEEDPNFDIAGRPMKVTKSGKWPKQTLRISFVKAYQEADSTTVPLPVIDMGDYEPIDLEAYLKEIKQIAEKHFDASVGVSQTPAVDTEDAGEPLAASRKKKPSETVETVDDSGEPSGEFATALLELRYSRL